MLCSSFSVVLYFLVSNLTCLTILHSLGSVGIGTIIAAVLVGTLVGLINRAFGSGGREIGKLLAKQLGFHYYDSELIKHVAEKSGYTPEYVEQKGCDIMSQPPFYGVYFILL